MVHPPYRDITKTSAWREGGLPAFEPDLIAAQFLESVLNREEMNPGPWLYHCLNLHGSEALREGLSRLGRLRFDYRYDLAEQDQRETRGADPLIDGLDEAIRRDPGFCRKLEPAIARDYLERPLLSLSIAVYQTLLSDTEDLATRARYENNLSVNLAESGDRAGGLDAIRRAVEIIEPFAKPGTIYLEWFEKMKRVLASQESS